MKTLAAALAVLVPLAAVVSLVAEENGSDSGSLRSPLAEKSLAAKSLASQLSAAASRAAGETYELKYKFAADESVRYRVEHLVTVDTTIEDNRQRARSRSLSTKVWDIREVQADGTATFVHWVSDADMWQQVTGFVQEQGRQVAKEKEHRYNSKSGEKPPLHYEKVAASIGKPLAEVSIDPSGALVRREDKLAGSSWGGQLLVPLPPEPVPLGHIWYKSQEIAVRHPDATVRRVKTRQQYRLKSVEDGIAAIELTTHLLTPGVRDQPRVMVQRLTGGTIEFDIAAGRVVRQRLKLDETIIGFNGPKSIMNYTGRFSEELLPAAGEAARTAAK